MIVWLEQKLLVEGGQLLGVHLHHLPVVGDETVQLALHIRQLGHHSSCVVPTLIAKYC